MTTRPSLAGRATLAVALMIGFYLLALGIAAGLLWIPYAEMVHAHRLHLRLVLFCVVGAGVILWSILPRRDRFEPPGPRVDPAAQPRLFEEVRHIAAATQQTMPAQVYLVSDVNAWVSERGGWMGAGGERVMGIGLPLLQLLKLSEFRGALAHEFGHYHGGDTKLGPWVYKTRAAIGRTLQGLAAHSSLLQKPFIWYGLMFLRLTHAVSRQQEYAADALAAGIVGTGPMISGLKTIHGAGEAFGAFWRGEAVPVLNAGFRPSLMDGFSRFLLARSVATAIAGTLVEEMQRPHANPYDTHPPLRKRVAALEELPPGAAPAAEPFASSLIDDVLELERQLLAMMGSAEDVAKLQSVSWEEVGVRVYLPQWQAVAQQHASGLAGVTPASLPERAKQLEGFARPLAGDAGREWTPEQAARFAAFVVGAAMIVALHGRWIGMRCAPGAPVSFHHADQTIEPFNALMGLATDQLTAENWQAQCTAFGISQLDLGHVGAASPSLGRT